ncbi:hypothetical protein [Nocardioides pantholopis]|uniref:hypothetical protein n=1 Tax=Nocardioides pantholopis TaxID=2483798 RepID=UPI000FDA42D3|nr:hypothetical protein [Nocardioides pantholopis]
MAQAPTQISTEISTGTGTGTRTDLEAEIGLQQERALARRAEELRSRHSQALSRLMEERRDLHGVHALADFVADSLRWTA